MTKFDGNLCMPAPPWNLEATETLMPKVMDVDSVWYLFETRKRVRGNFLVYGVVYDAQYRLEKRRCKMTQRLDWLYLTFFESN